ERNNIASFSGQEASIQRRGAPTSIDSDQPGPNTHTLLEFSDQLFDGDLALDIEIMTCDNDLEILASLRSKAEQGLAQGLDPSPYGANDNGEERSVFALARCNVRHVRLGSLRPRQVCAYELFTYPYPSACSRIPASSSASGAFGARTGN